MPGRRELTLCGHPPPPGSSRLLCLQMPHLPLHKRPCVWERSVLTGTVWTRCRPLSRSRHQYATIQVPMCSTSDSTSFQAIIPRGKNTVYSLSPRHIRSRTSHRCQNLRMLQPLKGNSTLVTHNWTYLPLYFTSSLDSL